MIGHINQYKNYINDDFTFCNNFLTYIETHDLNNLEEIELWWFFCKSDSYIDYWCQKIKKLYPDRSLVPFANWMYSDDIVCFDGNDVSGDPKVFFVHAFASPGWEDRGSVKNFDKWLEIAKKQSIEWKSGMGN